MADDRTGGAGDATAARHRERVAARAHEIWERAGCPDGQDVAHWQEAEDEIEAEDEGDRSSDAATAGPAATRNAEAGA